jgi:hypothetical protein
MTRALTALALVTLAGCASYPDTPLAAQYAGPGGCCLYPWCYWEALRLMLFGG